jgi:tetratricopeptide (TPR) repeat protein
VTEVPEKPPLISRLRVPALIATALVCGASGFLVSKYFSDPAAPSGESFSSDATTFTQPNLTQGKTATSTIHDGDVNLPASPPGEIPTPSGLGPIAGGEPAVKHAAPNLGLTENIAAQLAIADAHLRSGNLDPAFRIYEMLREAAEGPASAAVQYRLALTAEEFGDYATAIQQYESLQNLRSEPHWRGVAIYGRARCLDALGRSDLLARELLPLVTVDDSILPRDIRHEATHLLGRALLHSALENGGLQLLDDNVMSVPSSQVNVNHLLDALSQHVAAAPKVQSAPEFAIIQAIGTDADSQYLRIHMPATRIAFAATNIADRCGLQLEFSEPARVLVAEHSVSIHTDDRSLALLLDGLTVPHALTWQQHDKTIRVESGSEIGTSEARRRLAQAAERLQRNALLESPESAQAASTRTALGALLFRQDRIADAAHMFSLTLQSERRHRVRSETAFNLAKCQLRLQQLTLARQHFLWGLDAPTGSPRVRVACHLYAARIQIMQGEKHSAVTTLRRALAMSQNTNMETAAALMLSSAYLIAGSPPGANDILMNRRELFANAPDRAAAAFLSSLARFRAAVLPDRREREARSVVIALGQFDASIQFGSHWNVLAAEACSEIGLAQPARFHWQNALDDLTDGPLKAYVVSQLAEAYRANHEYTVAADLLRIASADSESQAADTILLQSARLSMQQGDFRATAEMCKTLLQRSTDPESQLKGMKLLGTAYERIGNHRAAVYCFAGMLSEAVASESAPEGALDLGAQQ